MTDEEIQLAMAHLAKWSCVRRVTDRNPDNDRTWYWGGSLRNVATDEWEVPDFLTDLNAVAQVEAKQDGSRYVKALYEVVIGREPLEHRDVQKIVTATARQRCIALLKVHGKWRD